MHFKHQQPNQKCLLTPKGNYIAPSGICNVFHFFPQNIKDKPYRDHMSRWPHDNDSEDKRKPSAFAWCNKQALLLTYRAKSQVIVVRKIYLGWLETFLWLHYIINNKRIDQISVQKDKLNRKWHRILKVKTIHTLLVIIYLPNGNIIVYLLHI